MTSPAAPSAGLQLTAPSATWLAHVTSAAAAPAAASPTTTTTATVSAPNIMLLA